MNAGFSVGVKSSEFIGFGVRRPVPNDNSVLQYSAGISYNLFNRISGSTQISNFEALTGENDINQSQFLQRFSTLCPKGFGYHFRI